MLAFVIEKKKWFIALLILIVTILLLRLVMLQLMKKEKSLYLALGDSITYGMLDSGQIGKSYVDYLAEDLTRSQMITTYNKQFSKAQLSSSQLLSMVENNSGLLKEGKFTYIKDCLQDAKYVSIQVGLYDILKLIKVDIAKATLTYDEEVVKRNLEILQSNLFESVEEMKVMVPKEQIFLLGYYFPYPSIETELEANDILIFHELNRTIGEVASDTGANYVDITSVSAINFMQKEDAVQPNPMGHEYIAILTSKAIKRVPNSNG